MLNLGPSGVFLEVGKGAGWMWKVLFTECYGMLE